MIGTIALAVLLAVLVLAIVAVKAYDKGYNDSNDKWARLIAARAVSDGPRKGILGNQDTPEVPRFIRRTINPIGTPYPGSQAAHSGWERK